MFLDTDISVKLLSVQKLGWESVDTEVQGRPFNALAYRIKGNCTITANGKTEKCESGNIVFVPEKLNYIQKAGEEEIIAVHFEINGDKYDDFDVFCPNDPETFKNLFTSLYDTWSNRQQGYYFRSVSILYSIFAKLNRRFSPIITNASYEKIRDAVNYIYKNFSDPTLTVEKLCVISNMSDTFFRRLFFEVFSSTPLKFINELRANYATEFLETGYYTVEEVAEKCGFSDAKYFSTTFKRVTGKTPSAVKKTISNQ